MALPIRSTHELIGKDAEIFIKNADFARAGFVDFTEQVEISRQIIDKAIKKNKSMKMTLQEMRDTIITI